MKILLILLFSMSFTLHAQTFEEESNVDSKYLNSVVPSEYDVTFKTDDDKKNFKKLREFLHEKENLLSTLRSEKLYHNDHSGDNGRYEKTISRIKELLQNAKAGPITLSPPEYRRIFGYSSFRDTSGTNETTKADLEYRMETLTEIVDNSKKEDSVVSHLNANIQNVKIDVDKCQSQIDSALAPEYKQQYFRTNISITFSILIGILLTIFFYIIYQKSDHTLSKDLLSGYGLQFITLFVLIIAVILFGILGILGSSELSAILSGISGYILGKGIRGDGTQSTTPANPALPSPQTVVQPTPVKPVPDLTNPANVLQ